MTFAISN